MSAKGFLVTAMGKDRPGIVAGVTKTLYQLGCNLEDSAMTRLGGEFAIMLMFEAPARVTLETLHRRFAALERSLRLVIHLKPLPSSERRAAARAGGVYTLSLYGADRPGIVFKVSEALAKASVNITDVQTRRSGTRRATPLYLVVLELELPPRLAAARLEQTLQRLGKSLGVEVSLRSADATVL